MRSKVPVVRAQAPNVVTDAPPDAGSSSESESEDEDEVLAFLAAKKAKAEQQQQKRPARSKKNQQANVHWRSISTEELRKHPLFTPLPPPEMVAIASPRDFEKIRQGSWQWDALHNGRLTTSKAAAALGFYEAKASGVLGVPKGLQGHARVLGAWQRLATEKPLSERDWALLSTNRGAKSSAPQPPAARGAKPSAPHPPAPGPGPAPSCWSPSPAQLHPYAHTAPRYVARRGYSSVSSARLAWGSAQESTAILQAVNFIHAQNAVGGMGGLVGRVCEVGLMPAEALSCEAGPEEALASLSLSDSRLSSPPPLVAVDAAHSLQQLTSAGLLPPLGASPDGLVRYYSPAPDPASASLCRSCEVIEVKCSSPFVTGPRDTIAVSPRPAPPLGSWHMPQVQLEILCAGPGCTGALLVVLTALQGATIYRVPRDDGYIAEMLLWLEAFTSRYLASPPVATSGGTKTPAPSSSSPAARAPEHDFFFCPFASSPQLQSLNPDNYRQFLLRTVRLAAQATVVQRLEESEVQRSSSNVDLLI